MLADPLTKGSSYVTLLVRRCDLVALLVLIFMIKSLFHVEFQNISICPESQKLFHTKSYNMRFKFDVNLL